MAKNAIVEQLEGLNRTHLLWFQNNFEILISSKKDNKAKQSKTLKK